MSTSGYPSKYPESSTPTLRTLRIGTRSSDLALAQVTLFTDLLSISHPTLSTTTHPSSTSLGDTNKVTNLHTLASTGKSLWTEDLEKELLDGSVDVIIHSLKDVPTKLPAGCVCAAVGARDEARDAVVMSQARKAEGWRTLGDLKEGGIVGTSSVRRAAMVRRMYPHLVIKNVRGNIGTRLRKLDDPSEGFDALVLAGAGVQRLSMGERISCWLGSEEGILHAVGQGAVGVEWREGDGWVGSILAEAGKTLRKAGRRVRWECAGERSLLRVLEGGCSVPVGVECVWEEGSLLQGDGTGKDAVVEPSDRQTSGYEQDDALPEGPDTEREKYGGMLIMRAMVVSLDGKECVEGTRRHYVSSDAEAEECGWRMAGELVDRGAGEILKEITLNRAMIRGQDGA
ncbi:MAG: porphobilinogen deaminase [Alectoria fallacina]|uniref:hydroxymethylbilane synthase n=1 Tax=Alectoria fallacina TaxID=1903189 RepID=A0A8H3ECG2_9LECA|nr:MAG: porphobilinogen deaminase [Alectoria fallacina]